MAKVMEKQDALQTAAEKLTAALDVIEQRFEVQLDEFAKYNMKEEQLSSLQEERVALKSELENARNQAHKMSEANQDVANRLDTVISSLKSMLGNEA